MGIRGRLRRIGRYLLIVLAALWVLFEEWVWNYFTALLAHLTRFQVVRRVEAVIVRQNRYVLLAMFTVPMLVMVPFKLYSFYLIGSGRPYQGLLVLITAKALGTAMVTRLFVISREKLLSVPLFARVYHWVQEKKQWLHEELAKVAWLAKVRQTARQLRQALHERLAQWRARQAGGPRERLTLFRAFLKKRLRPGG